MKNNKYNNRLRSLGSIFYFIGVVSIVGFIAAAINIIAGEWMKALQYGVGSIILFVIAGLFSSAIARLGYDPSIEVKDLVSKEKENEKFRS